MKYLAAGILILLAVWIAYAVSAVRRHKGGCDGCDGCDGCNGCADCDGCKNKKE